MTLFYTPDINGTSYILNEEESKHAVRVLRLVEGDVVGLIDGVGGMYKAKITESNPKRCTTTIIETQKEHGKTPFHLHVAIAPTKNNDRFEWFLEKVTEIGIGEITPLSCERSERKIVKTERLNKVLVAAIKQSVKAYLPKLNELTNFKQFVEQDFEGQKFIAHCLAHSEEKIHLKDAYTLGENALILIGPEGDFSAEEIKLALQNGFKEISLSRSRLRTETAGVVACDVINILNG